MIFAPVALIIESVLYRVNICRVPNRLGFHRSDTFTPVDCSSSANIYLAPIVGVWGAAVGWFGSIWGRIVGMFSVVASCWWVFRGAWNLIVSVFGLFRLVQRFIWNGVKLVFLVA